jgi:uncharacterized protein involved in outer membrane biogenesis
MPPTDVAPDTPPRPADPPPKRGIGKRMALVVGVLLVIALVVPLLVEIRIPLDALKPTIARHAREASGLDVRIDGPLYLVSGLHAGVEVHGLVVSGEHDRKQVEIVRLGVLRGAVELLPLIAREVRLRQVRAIDLTLHINPLAVSVVVAAERQERAQSATAPKGGWRWVDVTRLDVKHARLVLRTAELRHLPHIVVEDMMLRAAATEPLSLEARGSFVDEPMQLQLQTATLDQLRGGMRSIPAEFGVTLADASLKASGTFDVDALRGEYRVATRGHGRFLERLFPGFQAALGDVEQVSIEGVLHTAADAIEFESVAFAAGRTRGRGDFRYRVLDGRPQVRSQLTCEELDLRPWLPVLAAGKTGSVSATDLLTEIRAVQNEADVEFGWTVGHLIWPEREAQNVHANVQLDRQSASLSVSAHILAAAVTLDARLESVVGKQALRVDAHAGPLALEALHPKIADAGISGLVESAKLSAHGAGESLTALLRSLEGELDLQHVDASWHPVPNAAATRIKIDRATLEATRDALKGSFTGAIDDSRVLLRLSSARGVLDSKERSVQSAFELEVTRRGRRGPRISAAGTLGLDPEHWVLDVKRAALGTTRGSLALKGVWKADAPFSLRARFERFDVAALDFFMLESMQRRRRPVSWEQRVVLPSGLRLPTVDFDLSSKHLAGVPTGISDLTLEGRTRDGRLETTRYALRTAGGALRGELKADLSGRVPELHGSIAGSDLDLRPLLKLVDVTLDRAFAKRLDAKVVLRGARLKEIVGQSTLEVSAQELSAAIPGMVDAHRRSDFSGRFDARCEKGRLFATANGTLDGQALSLSSRGPELAALIARTDRVPLDIELSLADGSLEAKGTVGRGPQADLELRLAAKRVGRLLTLAGVRSTQGSALAASARLKLTPAARYAFESVDLQLGESHLTGRVVVDASARRPRIDATLAGPTLRLADLGIDASAAKDELVGSAQGATQKSDRGAWIALLRRFDGALGVAVDQLVAAGEPVGSLKVRIRIDGGRLRVAPLIIREGESALRAQGEVDVAADEPRYSVQAELKQYDLTPLLRSVDPKAVGSASLDGRMVLRSEGLGDAIVGNLDGTIDIASYAKDVGAGAIGLMGASIFELTLDRLDRAQNKKVNCAVGVFDVKDGQAKSRALFIDTTRLRILGNLDVNLVTATIDGGLRPYPKNPSLFNVSTPVDISGTLEHPKVSIANSALPELVVRYASPYTMLLSMLTQTENAKPDGSDDCRAAYAKAKDARPEIERSGHNPFKFLPWFGG